MAKTLGPVPGFPRWTGVKATVGPPRQHTFTRHADGRTTVGIPVSVRLTRRARWWVRWRMLTGRWPHDASAHG
jgi:hypothetical protein